MIVKIVRMVSLAGFEPTTLRLGIIRSIQLSYKDIRKQEAYHLLISPDKPLAEWIRFIGLLQLFV